jgi:SAM-dependent methyltransferase
VVGRFVRSLREQGAGETLHAVWDFFDYRRDRLIGDRADRRYGTDTSGTVELADLRIESDHVTDGVRYEPITRRYFRRMLRTVDLPYDRFTFVDLGSGKGRALLLAAEYPFRRIVGVEFAPELHEIALANVRRLTSRKKDARFELQLADAAAIDLPHEPLAIFLYNPFGERVLRQVVTRLAESVEQRPRDVVVFYRNPKHPDLIASLPRLRTVRSNPRYCVFDSRAGGDVGRGPLGPGARVGR